MPAAPRYWREPAAKRVSAPHWTEERKETVRLLWIEGQSASQIANVLGGITRNAVIGIVSRNRVRWGIEARTPTKTVRRPLLCGRKATGAQTRKAPPPLPRLVVAVGPELEPLRSLEQLEPHHCKWPIGDPQHADFGFCGRPMEHAPYCEHHARRAFVQVQSRPRSTPDETRAELKRMLARGW
jgi:GcrA cell cycle regulator